MRPFPAPPERHFPKLPGGDAHRNGVVAVLHHGPCRHDNPRLRLPLLLLLPSERVQPLPQREDAISRLFGRFCVRAPLSRRGYVHRERLQHQQQLPAPVQRLLYGGRCGVQGAKSRVEIHETASAGPERLQPALDLSQAEPGTHREEAAEDPLQMQLHQPPLYIHQTL